MPTRAKGIRLYLRKHKGRAPVYVIKDGRREIVTGCGVGAVKEANDALADYLSQVRPDTAKRNLSQVRVSEVIILYAQDIAPRKASAATIGYHVKALLPFWTGKTLADVKGSTCRKYEAYRAEKGVKATTVRRELKTLSAAINHWHGESPLAAVPKVTMPPEGERRERVLSRNEAAALLRAARRLGHKHLVRFILIGLYTGTRHNAILSLRWLPGLIGGHVELERGILYRRGSGERETSKRRPPVRIPEKLLGHMQRWQRLDAARGQARVIHYRRKPVKKERSAWETAVAKAGLGKDVTPHVLRHTCASWALWNGATIWDVAGLIGADASTVERTYGHHRLEAENRRRA